MQACHKHLLTRHFLIVTHMCSLDHRRPVRATRQDFASELGSVEGAAGDRSDTSHDTSAMRRSNVDVFVGDSTLQTIDKAKLWLPHGIGFWVVDVAWRVLWFCCGYHGCCGLNRKNSEIHVSRLKSAVASWYLISEPMFPFKYGISLLRSHRNVLAKKAAYLFSCVRIPSGSGRQSQELKMAGRRQR
jgi:hypothetical protein